MNEGMDVNSPENGFDDINNYLNNEDSTFPDVLGLDYIVDKDIAEDYIYGDLPVNEKIHLDLSEQQRQELPVLSSSFRCYNSLGSPSQNLYSSWQSEFQTDTLGRCEIVVEPGKLQIQSNENLCHDDTEQLSCGYFRDSIFQVDSDSVLDEIQNDASRQPQEVVSIQDANLQAILDNPDSSSHNEIGEHTCTDVLENECVCRDAHEEVSVHQTQNSCLSPGSRLRWDIEITSELVNESRNLPSWCKEFEPPNFDQKNRGSFPELYKIPITNGEMPGSPNHSDTVYHSPGIHELLAAQADRQIVSNAARSGKWTLSSIESNQCQVIPSENLVLNADQYQPASPRGLEQKSQQVANSPGEHVSTSLRQMGRVMSLSYVTRNKSFSIRKMHGHNRFHSSSPLHTGDSSQQSLDSSLSAPQHQLPNEEVVQLSYSTRSCKQKHESNKMSDYRRSRSRSPYAKNCKKKSLEVTPTCWSLKSKKASQESVPRLPYSSRSLDQKCELSETAMQRGSESRSQRNKAASPRSLDQKLGSTENCKRKRFRSRSSCTDELRKRSIKSSSYTHQSPSSQKVSMSRESLLQPSSSKPCKQKNESTESSNMGKRVGSNNTVGFRHSSSPGNSNQKPLENYSAKQSPVSPKNHRTCHNHGCRERSISPSRFKRKDLSSEYKGSIRNQSRRRSPYRRDVGTRTPRLSIFSKIRTRCSPGLKSPLPSYHSLRNSPRRPHWSPSHDRNTGIGKPGRNLFIAGFSFVTKERDLKRKFSEFGRVQDVRILRDKRSGDSRGFGFLSLERDEQADAAIRALDKTEWNGRIILVEKSKPH